MQELLQRAVVAFYWIALPFSSLLCAGWLMSALFSPSSPRSWMMAAGAGAFACLIGWRLWLNSRSLGRGGPLPPPRRLLLVFLPLAVLALAGFGLLATGIAALATGIWLLVAPAHDTSGFRDLISGPAMPVITGVILVLVGAGLIVPLARRLKTRPNPADSF